MTHYGNSDVQSTSSLARFRPSYHATKGTCRIGASNEAALKPEKG
jgi:hypothetical protein